MSPRFAWIGLVDPVMINLESLIVLWKLPYDSRPQSVSFRFGRLWGEVRISILSYLSESVFNGLKGLLGDEFYRVLVGLGDEPC